MQITELDKFRLTKAINFNTDLNPQIFVGEKMRSDVRQKLMDIADHFRESLGVEDIALVDIEVSGSNAAYSYTPHSDVDLHLIVDFTKLSNNEVYKELFNAKQYQYNMQHTIKIKSYDVELYVQDEAQQHHSLGSYSVLNDKWNKIPSKARANLDDDATLLKYERLKGLAIRALASDNPEYLNDVLDVVKKYRSAGLDQFGEFGPENLAFKMIRTDGYFAKLWAKKRTHDDSNLSLETAKEEPDTLAQELKAEFEAGATTLASEAMMKRLYAARESLFDEFDYDTLYEAAGNLTQFEAAYDGNLGAMEMMQFYKNASKDHISLLQRLIAAKKSKEAWSLVQKFTGTELQGKEFALEGVGIITTQNQTADVGPNQTKIEAQKLGFKVNKGGIPEIPTNGVPKSLYENLEPVMELDMSPGGLQNKVDGILKSAGPRLGLEFEVCIKVDEDQIPQVSDTTSMQDLKDTFDNGDDDEVWDEIEQQHMNWIQETKEPNWVNEQVVDAMNIPNYNDSEKTQFMQDFSPSGEANDFIAEITGDEDNIELTEEIAIACIEAAQAAYKKNGEADTWPVDEASPPLIKLYYDVFVEDNSEATDMLTQLYQDDFWSSEFPNSYDYSLGNWFLESQITSFREIKNEFADLYSDSITQGGDYSNGGFDYDSAHNIASEMQYKLGFDVEVIEEDEEPDYSVWNITLDSSIKPDGEDDGGLEIVMPITPYEEAIDDITAMFAFLDSANAYTNESTGLHINVSLANIDHSQLDYAKLVLLVGDKHVSKQFSREFNQYAINSLSGLKTLMDPTQGFERDKAATATSYADMMGKMKGKLNHVVSNSFENLNFGKFSSVGMKDDRIEFRSVGGDYLSNFEDLITAINRFVIAYVVACDPEAYKNEYAKKLYKIASNVQQDNASNSSLELFARFGSGLIDKDDLIRLLKAQKAEKAGVDTGEPEVPEQPSSTSEAIGFIATRAGKSNRVASVAWQAGWEIEMRRFADDKKKAAKAVYIQLMRNIGYYTDEG